MTETELRLFAAAAMMGLRSSQMAGYRTPAAIVEVLPGAYSGSVCSRALSGKPAPTIGFGKRHNRAFRIADEEAFVDSMRADIPLLLPRARELRASNAGWSAA